MMEEQWCIIIVKAIFEPASAVKFLTLFLKFFLIYHKEKSFQIYSEYAWPNPSKIFCQKSISEGLHIYQHTKLKIHNSVLLWDIVKTLRTCYFKYFRYAWSHPSKIIVSIYRKVSCSSTPKYQLHPSLFFLRYCRDFANLLFWVIWAGLVILTKISGINFCRIVWCLYACKKSTLSLPFLRYCKDITILLFWVIWACLTMTSKNSTISL